MSYILTTLYVNLVYENMYFLFSLLFGRVKTSKNES